MESRHRLARTWGCAALAVLVCCGFAGCGDQPLGLSESAGSDPAQSAVRRGFTPRATGTVEIVWPGGLRRDLPAGEEKLAFAEFDAFPATSKKPARGSFTYRVLNADYTPHREIVAVVSDAVVDGEHSKAWFVAQVVSDTRICSGSSCSGHDDGTHDDGGCSGSGGHDDGTHDDGGCSGSGGHDDGTHDDGGCSGSGGHDDGTHDDGGCSGNSGGDHGDGGQSSPGGRGLSGKDPRVGQIVLVKVHDRGTPGTNGDGIAWKWLAPDTDVNLGVEPRCMCKKEIIGGNLVVHSAG